MLTEKLLKLYNTLAEIETKGNNTKTMALCLGYLENLINEEATKENELAKKPVDSTEEEEEKK